MQICLLTDHRAALVTLVATAVVPLALSPGKIDCTALHAACLPKAPNSLVPAAVLDALTSH